jgi:hypothetical protein
MAVITAPVQWMNGIERRVWSEDQLRSANSHSALEAAIVSFNLIILFPRASNKSSKAGPRSTAAPAASNHRSLVIKPGVIAFLATGGPLAVGTGHWRNETLKQSKTKKQENAC